MAPARFAVRTTRGLLWRSAILQASAIVEHNCIHLQVELDLTDVQETLERQQSVFVADAFA